MPLIGSCWEFELPLALFSHQCKCTTTPPPFLSFSNVLVEAQNQNDDFSNVWMHMSSPTTKFTKIEWPNHMNSWESGLAFSLSFCWVSLQTSGDSSWQKQVSFFPLHPSVLSICRQLAPRPLGAPQIAADCRRVNDFCTRHDWDVTTGGNDAVLLKANSLLCSHSHRDHRFCIYILPNHRHQRSVDNTCFRAFDWLNNTLIQNKTIKQAQLVQHWVAKIWTPKSSMLLKAKSLLCFFFNYCAVHFGQCCNILWLFVSCLWMCLPFPRLATSAFGQALSRLSLNTILHHKVICICISISVFVFVHLYFFFCSWIYICIWTGIVPPFP